MDLSNYIGREQSYVKHVVLDIYLERFAHIIGSWKDSITYIDGFSGPWNSQTQDFSDSSFGIALGQLRKARADLKVSLRRDFKIRCFFVEESPEAFTKLKGFTDSITDATIKVANSTFEAAIPDICTFVKTAQGKTFPFILIDPKGWKGFGMAAIKPLLDLRPSEVLINFMTGHIKRFVVSPEKNSQEQFEELFGDPSFREKVQGLTGPEREFAAVNAYADNLAKAGKFEYVCKAIVLNPNQDKTHYHLIYATRNSKGVIEFKRAEKSAMEEMEKARALAKQRGRTKKTGQDELFAASADDGDKHFADLREAFLTKAKASALDRIKSTGTIAYDELWKRSMEFPLVWDSDLKDWLKAWKDAEIDYTLAEGKRVPQLDQNIVIRAKDPTLL